MRILVRLTASLLLAGCGAVDASTSDAPGADARAAGDKPAPVTQPHAAESLPLGADATSIEVIATIDGERYNAAGAGECKHAAQASIYGVNSAMWLAQYFGDDDVRTVALTLWRPQTGDADQLSLTLTIADRTSRITTVQGGKLTGSGAATLDVDGAGGRLRVQGRDGAGAPVTLDVHCSRFTALEAVGG